MQETDLGDTQNQYQCSICLDIIEESEENLIVNNCKHQYHSSCINDYIRKQIKQKIFQVQCPYCRNKIDQGQYPEGLLLKELKKEKKQQVIFISTFAELRDYRITFVDFEQISELF
ncbi:hypothetical protein PPERSA_12942 [Pseudocohnilembus persalinus]|uniref:RING-type domain-containing protein n=1 Tax=Pseudocohnilembus persalinus TaxID=266149 RepID=A0A0V0R256_PSEPJ|nr:hypothetical protein PPERSA_12942 [Pseudocohnilembus persalinus]|eukprot:KRX08461.1 hypothetical protein PPERSA_12942 [Pseudocohnilembus persalinus]